MSIDREKALSSNTTKSFITALVVNAGLLTVEVGAFIVLKEKLWRIYTPRTTLPPPDKRAFNLPSGLWKWLPAIVTYPTKDIIHKNGLDAYMFLRFLKILMKIFLLYTILTFAVIIPADAIGITSAKNGLERISWSNIIEPRNYDRFAAHITVTYILTFFVLWTIRREMANFVRMRHQFLISEPHSTLAQARTVVISSVPGELANEHDLRTFASFVPGGVDRVWLFRDTRSLNESFEERQEACEKLEAAITRLLKLAVLAWRKVVKRHRKLMKHKAKDTEYHNVSGDPAIPPITPEFLSDLVPLRHRPSHRTGPLGLIGQKVDTIDWYTKEIADLNIRINENREHLSKGKFLGSAFIRCNLQIGAHVLAQCLSYHEPLKMSDKWLETHPKDIVWHNLDDGALEMRSRYVISWIATFGLIVVWAFPVTFIGTLSNLDDLCVKVPWLRWLCEAPTPIPGIIQGFLPPVLLAALLALLPFILRGLAWYECIPRYSLIAVSVYKRFYFFLLVHGFLIVTLSSGITRAIQDMIENPTKAVQQLANQLPGASVFFLTYMVTQGLAGAGAALLQLLPLVIYFIKKWFLGRTPRQAYEVTFLMPSADFGVILPRLSLLATIGFAYSVLAPLINLLALICYTMYFVAFKFLLTQVYDQKDEMETAGLYFPMAINNLFVGLYIQQICLACLFFLNASGSTTIAIVQAAFMLVLLVITAFMHAFLNHSFNSLIHFLPMSLATNEMAKKFTGTKRQTVTEVGEEDNGDLDLFNPRRLGVVRRRIRKTKKKLDKKLNALVRNDSDSDEGRQKLSEETVAEEIGGIELYKMDSFNSEVSKVSGSSKKSLKGKEKSGEHARGDDDVTPGFSNDSDVEAGNDDDDVHAFDHPSTYKDQPWIWVPKDPLGLSTMLVKQLQDAGVSASDMGAEMKENGIVEVSRNPPDNEWSGGHDA